MNAKRDSSQSGLQSRLALIGVAVIAFATYWPTWNNAQFVDLDDYQYAARNPRVMHPSWENALAFLTEVRHPQTVAGYYQPFTMISLMVDGTVASPGSAALTFHRTNILIHIFNATLVFLVLRQLGAAAALGFFGALLFACHPVQVESVAWISQRKTVLSGSFFLLMVLSHLRYVRSARTLDRVASAVAFGCGLLCKPTILLAPLVLVALDVMVLHRPLRRACSEKWPAALLMVMGAFVAWLSQTSTNTAEVAGVRGAAAVAVAELVAFNVAMYGRNLVWPSHLALLYPSPDQSGQAFWFCAAGFAVVFVGMVVIAMRRRWPAVAFGVAGFACLIAPSVGFVRVMESYVGDRHLYLPLVVLVMALVLGVQPLRRLSLRQLATASAAVVCVILTVASHAQQVTWSSTEALWTNVVKHHPHQHQGNASLAQVYVTRADLLSANAATRRDELNKALALIDRAIANDPGFARDHDLRGYILKSLDRNVEAAESFETALRLGAGEATVQAAIGLAECHLVLGHSAEAIDLLDQLRLNRSDATFAARLAMAEALANGGQFGASVRFYEHALSVGRESVEARLGLARALAQSGNFKQAITELERCRTALSGDRVRVADLDAEIRALQEARP